jgi:hypothetical protein
VEERKEERKEKLAKEENQRNAVEKIKVENLAEKDIQKEENLVVEKEDAHENVLENARGENAVLVHHPCHLDPVWGVKIELNAENKEEVIHNTVVIYQLHQVIRPLIHLLCHGLPVLEAFPVK